MLLAFGDWGMALLRLVPLIVVSVKLRWLAKTPREREEALRPGPFPYAVAYSQDLVVSALPVLCVVSTQHHLYSLSLSLSLSLFTSG